MGVLGATILDGVYMWRWGNWGYNPAFFDIRDMDTRMAILSIT